MFFVYFKSTRKLIFNLGSAKFTIIELEILLSRLSLLYMFLPYSIVCVQLAKMD